MAQSLYSYECSFVVVPGDTLLFEAGLTWLPQEGMIVENFNHNTAITTRYRVQDVILNVEEHIPVPPVPPPDPVPATAITRAITGWRIEVTVLP